MARKKVNTEERLELRYVSLSQVEQWEENPKRHDISGLTSSIRVHGFKDPPKFEPALNDGRGGVVTGNGRIQALRLLHDTGADLPRGIVQAEDGDWLVPVMFGVDAASAAAAAAYAVDHNNLTISGADFPWLVLSQIWEESGYANVLQQLSQTGELPVTVSQEDLALLIADLDGVSGPAGEEEPGEPGPGSSGEASRDTAGADPAALRIPFQFGAISATASVPTYERFVAALRSRESLDDVLAEGCGQEE